MATQREVERGLLTERDKGKHTGQSPSLSDHWRGKTRKRFMKPNLTLSNCQEQIKYTTFPKSLTLPDSNSEQKLF